MSAVESTRRTWLVVPCYNESQRMDAPAFIAFARSAPNVGFIFVNDGSADGTLSVLESIRTAVPGQVRVIDQQPNQGKAEAVRTGLLAALQEDAAYVGYYDADLATPLDQIDEFTRVLDHRPDIDIVLGARVSLLGRRIERRASRHYSGRVFATVASLALGLPVYDTQCGAKLLRPFPALRDMLASPFGSRWIFDVELLARYLALVADGAQRIYELPLRQWTDVGESHVRTTDFLRAVGEMAQLLRRYRLARPGAGALDLLAAPFLRYTTVGALGTALHYTVLVATVELVGGSPVTGTVVGACAGAALNYFLNYHLTFVSTANHRNTLPRFVVVAGAAATASGVAMSWLVGRLELHYLIAQVLVTAGVLVGGYLMNRLWTFAETARHAGEL